MTIRIYFQWFEGENESMNDIADTNAGYKAAEEGTTFTINANINFEQFIKESVIPLCEDGAMLLEVYKEKGNRL